MPGMPFAKDHDVVEAFPPDRADAVCVTAKRCLPSMGGRSSPPVHVFGSGGLSNIDAGLEQFTLDASCAPQWVGDTHLLDQGTDFQRQNARSPRRSQPITVPGLTIDREFRVPGIRRYNHTKSSLSVLAGTSRSGLFQRMALSRWRNAMISVCRSARD